MFPLLLTPALVWGGFNLASEMMLDDEVPVISSRSPITQAPSVQTPRHMNYITSLALITVRWRLRACLLEQGARDSLWMIHSARGWLLFHLASV